MSTQPAAPRTTEQTALDWLKEIIACHEAQDDGARDEAILEAKKFLEIMQKNT